MFVDARVRALRDETESMLLMLMLLSVVRLDLMVHSSFDAIVLQKENEELSVARLLKLLLLS